MNDAGGVGVSERLRKLEVDVSQLKAVQDPHGRHRHAIYTEAVRKSASREWRRAKCEDGLKAIRDVNV